jgi:hypothetical protein
MTAGPTNGTSISPQAKAVRQLLLLDRAKTALGGAEKLGDILGVCRRSVNRKLSADRGVTTFELNLTADAIEARALELQQLAADLRGVAG